MADALSDANFLDCRNSDAEVEPPAPKRSRKCAAGASTYETKFNKHWSKEFPFIQKILCNKSSTQLFIMANYIAFQGLTLSYLNIVNQT